MEWTQSLRIPVSMSDLVRGSLGKRKRHDDPGRTQIQEQTLRIGACRSDRVDRHHLDGPVVHQKQVGGIHGEAGFTRDGSRSATGPAAKPGEPRGHREGEPCRPCREGYGCPEIGKSGQEQKSDSSQNREGPGGDRAFDAQEACFVEQGSA